MLLVYHLPKLSPLHPGKLPKNVFYQTTFLRELTNYRHRSVTTPLAMVVANLLEADANSTVCFVVLTGILGTIVGPYLLKLLKVREEDYLTTGLAMGIGSHAIATASLLRTNPRAAAIASLSFVIFGTLFVIVVSIPVIPQTLRQLVGF